MRFCTLILLSLFTFGCSTSGSKEDLKHLNGYWEIALVEFPNGQKKEYTKASTTIDYFEWDGKMGFRKKVYPKLDGTFDTTDDAEPFEIIENDGQFKLHYQNEMSTWQETLVKLEANQFSVLNEDGIVYRYHRHKPIKLVD